MWTVEQMLEIAAQNGRTLTREQAAFDAYCFNEAEKTNASPISIAMKAIEESKARQNLGKANSDSGLMPKKRSWQL